MVKKIVRIASSLRSAIILLVIIGVSTLFIKSTVTNQIPLLSNTGSVAANPGILAQTNSTSTKVTTGALSGNAYLSNDSSAFSKSKVTFGSSNSVSFSYSSYNIPTTTILTGDLNKSRPISPLDFGANEIWYDGGYGAQNPQNNQIYSDVTNLTKQIGVSILRYPGGIPSDTFHWQSAIGPESGRSDNVVYQGANIFLPSTFGPDEYGKLLQDTNSVGDITVNFGTGTAQEAANWVQYMTAPSKNNYWGELRAKNGHSAPYNIPYWEVGNETQSSAEEYYWRSGSLISINTENGACRSSNVHLCEYVYGGTTAFSRQRVLGTNNQPDGQGTPSQVFYAQYPPIVQASQTVFVDGRVWQQVSSINDAPANQRAYQLDNQTGQITFGNGVHGAIPTLGSVITISYDSGPHDGFLQYYNLMKAADPKAKVCSSYEATDFIQLMGSNYHYDCLVSHLYAGGVPSSNSSASLFHNSLMQQSYDFTSTIASEQAAIKQFAGSRANDISLAVTEYGVNALTSPYQQPNYHRSQDIALFIANTLNEIINADIPIAEKHYLISYEDQQPDGPQAYINSQTFANNALIGGPGSNAYLQPGAYAIEAYSKYLYPNLISSSVFDNPSVTYSGGSYQALSVIASTDKKGDESIIVTNLSPDRSITSAIKPNSSSLKKINSWTLGSNSYLAYNTASDPSVIGFAYKSAELHNGQVNATFPPSSITIIQLEK